MNETNSFPTLDTETLESVTGGKDAGNVYYGAISSDSGQYFGMGQLDGTPDIYRRR